jgi:CRP-like cAMP-binding protein
MKMQLDGNASLGFNLSLTRSLIPLKDMSESHLLALLSSVEAEMVCAGQTIFSRGNYDGQHVYLLHGAISLLDENDVPTLVKGGSILMPLAHFQPRRFTAIANTDCCVLRLNSERLDKMLAWSQIADYLALNISRERDLDEDSDWMMAILRSNLFFKVPPINVEDIFSRLKTQIVYAGDVIIREGELGDQCYFIKEGVAEVWRNADRESVLLATIGAGRCFGEDALVDDAVRNASVVMRTDGVLMCLDKQSFFRLLKEPQVPSVNIDDLKATGFDAITFVDVRSEEEYNEQHIQQAVNLPLNFLGIKSRLLSKERAYYFYCDTGRRSRAAVHLLSKQGYKVFALDNCAALFSQPYWREFLDSRFNYVLKDGIAIRGI